MAGVIARVRSCRSCEPRVEEDDAVAMRPAAGARRLAVDARGRHGVDKLPVGAGVTLENSVPSVSHHARKLVTRRHLSAIRILLSNSIIAVLRIAIIGTG